MARAESATSIPCKDTRTALKPSVSGFVVVLLALGGNLLWLKCHVNQRLLQRSSPPMKRLSVLASLCSGVQEITHGSGEELKGAAKRNPAPPAFVAGDGQASSACCRAVSLVPGPAPHLTGTPALLQVSWQELLGAPNPALETPKGPTQDILKKAI